MAANSIKPIRSKTDYEAALAEVEQLELRASSAIFLALLIP